MGRLTEVIAFFNNDDVDEGRFTHITVNELMRRHRVSYRREMERWRRDQIRRIMEEERDEGSVL